MVLEQLPQWSVGIVKLLAVIVGSYLVGRLVVRPVSYRILRRRSVHVAKPFSRFFLYVTVLAGLVAGLSIGGYGQTLGVVGAVVAAGTFALGFGMQDTLKSLLAGVFIFVDRPFEIGDWIEWGADYEGRVQDIRLRTTKVRTFDNELLTVPNDQIANSTVTNNSANETLRLKTTVGIGYEDDIEKAKKIIWDVLQNTDAVLSDPEPEIVLQNLGESTVDIQFFFWVENPGKQRMRETREEILEDVKTRFDAEGIDMPFPTRTIAGDSLDTGG